MSKAAADQFADILAAAGTPRVYGIVGDSLSGPTDAIRRRSRLWQQWELGCGHRWDEADRVR